MATEPREFYSMPQNLKIVKIVKYAVHILAQENKRIVNRVINGLGGAPISRDVWNSRKISLFTRAISVS